MDEIKVNDIIKQNGSSQFKVLTDFGDRFRLVNWDGEKYDGFVSFILNKNEIKTGGWKKKGPYNPQMSTGRKLHSKGKAFLNKTATNNNYGKIKQIEDTRAGTREKYPTTIWTVPKPHPSVAQHRTEKPVLLLEKAIKTYSNVGDIVLDNTAGSGPTVEACIKTGRSYIVVEKDPLEFAKILKRKERALADQQQLPIILE